MLRRYLMVGALAGVGILASTGVAHAQSISVIDEATGADCSPCSVHLAGESHVTSTASGIVLSACEDELFAHLQADGTGAIDWVGTAHGGPGCNVRNCVTPVSEAHWPITSIIEPAAGLERIQVRLCFKSATTGIETHCNLSIPVSHPEPHRQTLNVLSLCSSGLTRLEATWTVESAQVELVHN